MFLIFQIVTSILLKSQFIDTVVSNPGENIGKIQRSLTKSDIHLQKTNYAATDELKVELGRYVPDKLFVYSKNAKGDRKQLKYKVDANGLLLINPPSEMTPGVNTIEITDGTEVVYTNNFEWGVLALNTNKDSYLVGETGDIQMSVLDDKGEMVCKAQMTLQITSPSKVVTTLSTKDKTIAVTDYCNKKEFTLVPDYKASYKFDEVGDYTFQLKAITPNGERSMDSVVSVKDSLDFQITRITATRIYPVLEYPVTIKVKSKNDFIGTIVEQVPSSFNIKNIEGMDGQDKSEVAGGETSQKISYKVDMKAGEEVTLGYTYKAPEISPEFYNLGKITISDGTSDLYVEKRMWQIAVDSVGYTYPTRLWTSGFELNSTTADMEYTANIGTTPTISSGTVRSGTYSLNTTLGGAATSGIRYEFTSAADTATATYARAYIRISTLPNGTIQVMCFRDNAGTYKECLRMTTGGILQLYNEEDNAQVGSNSSALSTNTWYRLEMEFDFGTNGTGNTIMSARIDGVSFARSTTQNLVNGITFLDLGILQSGTANFFWDDLAINQDSYASQFNWPGSGKVVNLHPDGNGTNTAWTNDFNNVKEVTPDDAGTVITCSANGQLEDYTLQNTSTPGIGANDIIKLAAGNVRVGGAASNLGNSYSISLLNAGGGIDTSATVAMAVTTTYYTNDDTYPENPPIFSYDDPGAANYGTLTPSIVDGMTVRLNAVDCSPVFSISTVWVTVEYVPAEGGRVFSSGFELQSVTADMEWTTINSTPAITTATKRSGAAALQINTLASTTRKAVNYQFASANSNGPYYFRAYIYINTAPSAENRIIDVRNSSGTAIAYITVDNTRALKLYDNVGVIGSASTALSLTTWYRIEIKADASLAGGSQVVEGKVDGNVFATSSSRTLSSGVYQLGLGGNLNSEAQTTGDWIYDDVAINQNVGTTQNGYPGPGKIVHLLPNGAGDTSGWTNTYTNVDEVPPNDITDYVTTSTLNAVFEANVQDSSTYTIDATQTINLVSAGVRATVDVNSTMAFALRIKDGTGGPFSESGNVMTPNTTWFTNNSAAPRNYQLTSYTRPEQETAWTSSALDGAQVGARETVDTANNIRVTSMWLLVEYSPITINVSGTCKAFDESTACGDTGTIRVAVGSVLQPQIQPTVAGTWTVGEITKPATNAVVTVYIEGAANADKAAAVTKYDGTGDITNIELDKEHLMLGNTDNANLSNTDIGTYDNSVSGSADVFFDNSGTTLTVDNTGFSTQEKLYIYPSNTYTPGGTVNTFHMANNGTISAGANTINVAGSWGNAGTFTAGTSTVNMTRTSGGGTLGPTLTTTSAFYNLTFNGVGGAWTFGANAATVSNDFTITNGTVTAPSTTLTIGNNYSNSGTFTHNSGTVTMSATDAGNTLAGTMTTTSSFYNLTFNGSGGAWSFAANPATVANDFTITLGTVTAPSTTLTITGSYSNSGTFTHNYGIVLMNSTAVGKTLVGTMTTTSAFYDLTFNGSGGAWSFAANSADVAGNLTITAGTLTAPSTTLSVAGNYSNAGTFTHNSGTVNMNGVGITNPSLYWNFDENTGTAINTKVVGGQNGTAANTSWVAGKYDTALSFNGSSSRVYATNKANSLTNNYSMSAWIYTATLPQTSPMIIYNGNDSGGYGFGIGNGGGGSGSNLVGLLGAIVWIDSGYTLSSSTWYYVAMVREAGITKFYVNGTQTSGTSASTPYAPNNAFEVGHEPSYAGRYFNGTIDEPKVYDYALTQAQISVARNQAVNGYTMSGTMTTTSSFYNLTFNGSGGAWTFGANNATVANNLTITAGTVTAPSTTLTITGSYSNSGTFTHNSGTVLFNSTTTAKTLAGVMTTTSSFYNLTFNGSGGAWSFGANSATVANDFTITLGTLTAPSTTLTITGNYSNSATFTHNSGTVTFNSTTTGKTLVGTMTTTSSFYNLTFNGSGGAWSFAANSATVANNLTITAGTVTAPSTTLTITGSYSNSGTFTHNSGTVLFNATTTGKTLSGTMTTTSSFYNLTFNGSGGAWSFGANSATVANDFTITLGTLTAPSTTLTITGNYSNSATFTHNSGTVTFNSTTTGKTLVGTMTTTSSFYNLTFNGSGGAWSFGANNVLVVYNFTITNGTVTAPSTTLTIGNNYSNSGTFTHNSGTVIFNAPNPGKTLSGTMTTTSSFYNLTFNGVGGAWSFGGNAATVVNDLVITNGTITFPSTTLTIGGNFSNAATFISNSGTVLMNATITGKTLSGLMSGGITNNFANLTFNGVGGAWSFGSNGVTVWNNFTITNGTVTAPSSLVTLFLGGSYSNSGTFVHNSGTVYMSSGNIGNTLSGTMTGSSSFYNLTIDGLDGGEFSFGAYPATVINNFTITASTATVTAPSTTLTITGNYSNGGTFIPNSGLVLFNATTTGKTITNGNFYNIQFNGSGGGWTFSSNPTSVTHNFTITNGTVVAPFDNMYIGGSYSNSGTFTNNSGGIIFNSTTTGNTLSGTMTGSSSFYDLFFDGVGGAWSFGSNSATVTDVFDIFNGSVTAPSSTLTLGTSYYNGASFIHNNGTVLMNATSGGRTLSGTMTGSSAFYNLTFNGVGGAWTFGSTNADINNNFTITNGTVTASSGTLSIGGNYTNSATFINNSGTVLMSSTTTGHTLSGTMTSPSQFCNLTFNGLGGTWSFSSANVTLDCNFTIIKGTVTAPSGTLSIAGNYTNQEDTASYRKSMTIDNTANSNTLTNPQIVLDEGEVAHWRLDETSGTNVADSSGNNLSGTSVGAAVTTGHYNNARTFGYDNYVDVTYPNLKFGNRNSFTISAWAYKTSYDVGRNQTVFVQQTTQYNGFNFGITTDGSDNICAATGNAYVMGYYACSPISLNTWTFVTMTYNNGAIILYVDGSQTATATYTGGDVESPDWVATIGNDYYSTTSRYWDGKVDEVRVYDRVLSPTEVAFLHTNNLSPLLGSIYTHTQEGGQDLRFVNSDGTSQLSYWVEKYTASGENARVRVLIPSISANSTKDIYINYGDPTATSNSSVIPFQDTSTNSDANLMGLWRMDEATGTTLIDSSTHGNTGTFIGTTGGQWQGGKIGPGLQFDGGSNSVSVNNSSSVQVGNNVTMSMWIRKTMETNYGMYMTKNFSPSGGDSTGWYQLMNYGTSGRLSFRATNDGDDLISNASIPIDTWTHIAVTYDGSTATIYINGAYDNSISKTVTPVQTTDPLIIGARSDGMQNGVILDAVRLYNRALNSTEILALLPPNRPFVSGLGSEVAGVFSNSGIFTHNNGTVLMNSTSTGKTLVGNMTTPSAFYNLTFNGSGGAWTFAAYPASAENNFTITTGTVTAPSTTLSVGGNYSNSGVYTHNSGTFIANPASGSKTLSGTMTGSSSFYNFTSNGANAFANIDFGANSATVVNDFSHQGGSLTFPSTTLTVGGNFSLASPISNNGGTIIMNATTTGKTITGIGTYGWINVRPLYNLIFNGVGGGWTLGPGSSNSSGAAIQNDFTITNGTVIAPTTNLQIGGNYSNSGTFTNSSGTVTMIATSGGKTLSGSMIGSSSFYNLIFDGSGGAWSFATNPATVANDLTVTTGNVTAPSTTLSIGGNYSNSDTFTHNSGTVLMNSTATGKTLSGTMTSSSSFYNLVFNGTGGAWSFGSNAATTINDFSIIAGNVTAPSSTLTVGGNYSNSELSPNSGKYRKAITVDNSSNSNALSNYQVKVDEGEIGRWKMDENTGTSVANSANTTNSTNVSLNNATWTSSGQYSNAVVLNGSSAYGTVSNLPDMNSITLSVWVKRSGNGSNGYPRIVSWTNYGLEIADYNNTGVLGINTPAIGWINTGQSFGAGWNNIALTVSGTTTKLYFNGSYINTYTGGLSASGTMYIGKAYTLSEYFNGQIDETRIYDHALSSTDISSLYTNNRSPMLDTVYSNTQESGADLRFTDSDGTTQLNYWVERYTASGQNAKVWVKVPSIGASTTKTIYVYYGNPTASSNSSVSNTFVREVSNLNRSYSMDEASWTANCSSNTVFDSSGNGYHLKACNAGATVTAGKFGNGGSFSSAYLSGTYAYIQYQTFLTWAKPTGAGSIITSMPSSNSMVAEFDGSGNLTCSVVPAAHFAWHSCASSGVNMLSAWHYVGCSFDSSGNINVFVDGAVNNSCSTGHTTGLYNYGDTIFQIGKSYSGAYYPGQLDQYQVFSSALTTPEVTDLYNNYGYSTLNYTGKVLVRKYSSPEPGVSAVGAETANSSALGTFTHNSGTVIMNSTSTGKTLSGTMTTSSAFNNLWFDGVGGAWSFDVSPATVLNDFLINNGAVTAPSTTLLISEHFTNLSGTFTHNSGTVTFNDNTKISQIEYKSDTTFYNFSSVTGGKQIFLENVNQTNVTGTLTINGQACGSFIKLYSDASGNQAKLNATGTVSITYAEIKDSNAIVALTATNSKRISNDTNWTITGGVCNGVPNSPSSLAQKFTSNVVINTGDWINQNSINFTANISDPNNPDTIYLCVELVPIATTFSNYETLCSTGYSYTGSPVAATVSMTSITDQTEYHWQARTKDIFGEYSAWVSYGANLESVRDVGLDLTVPTGGTVYDGTSIGSDISFNNGSLSSISANWSGFDSTISGLNHYDYSIGTTQGGTDVVGWTANSTSTSVTVSSLTLISSKMYFFNVRATDNATNISSVVSSNGQVVAPSLSFSLDTNTINFGNLNGNNSYETTKTNVLTTSTNAYNGYLIKAYETDLLRSVANGSLTIPNFSLGSYATPSGWTGSNYGFGYSSSDTSIQGSGKFPASGSCLGTGTAPCYAPFATSGPGDIVADHTATVSGTPITNETFTITYKVKTQSTQTSGQYVTSIVYTVIPQY
ncbi:MAG: DUF2341 domain-containing protein [bacterium]